MWRAKLALVGLALLMSACQPIITAPTPQTVDVWQVQYTPALSWLTPALNVCAQQQPGVALIVHERSAAVIDSAASDFTFIWDAPQNPPGSAYVLAQENLVFIVNAGNPLSSIKLADLQAAFAGEKQTWAPALQADIHPWVYDRNEDVQRAFSDAGLRVGSNPTYAGLAPSPSAMLQAIQADRAGIGYIPARWMNNTVKPISVEGLDNSSLTQPILALTPQEPSGARKAWLLCVQAEIQ